MFIQFLLTLGSFIFGAVIGSFLSVLMYRFHKNKEHTLKSRSQCVHCEAVIEPRDLIPLVSYLTLRGKCRSCRGPISAYYPLLELFTGLLFALMYIKYPFIGEGGSFSGVRATLYLISLYYMSVLSFSFFYDLKHMLVSDRVIVPAILIALIATLLPGTPHTINALIGGGLAFAFFGFQILISKGRWVGGGDVRIGIFIGMILGWQLLIVALFTAYVVGAITAVLSLIFGAKSAKSKIPFVPFLVLGALAAIFLGPELIDWYLAGFTV